eukprot:2479378-Alexandrium_andersonii.AAC.1
MSGRVIVRQQLVRAPLPCEFLGAGAPAGSVVHVPEMQFASVGVGMHEGRSIVHVMLSPRGRPIYAPLG